MTPREQLISMDCDKWAEQAALLQEKLESAQFDRDQERARAEKAEAACAEMRDQLNRIRTGGWQYVEGTQIWTDIDNALDTDAGNGWLSPDQKRETIEALESIAEHHAETECWRDIANKMLSKLKESQ